MKKSEQSSTVPTEGTSRGRGQGRIVNKRGSKKLYVDFFYFGERLEKSMGFDDTPENRVTVNKFLDKAMERIDHGTFRFAEAFPNASDAEKAHFAKLEGWSYTPEASDILFRDYLLSWRKDVLDQIKSHTKREDYRSALESQIEPYFAEMTFFQINSVTLQKFFDSRKHTRGSKIGEPLSDKRIKTIRTVLRSIWKKACEVHRWSLPDPFEALKGVSSKHDDAEEAIDVNKLIDGDFEEVYEEDFLEGGIPTDRHPLRFWEWLLILHYLDECNRLNATFMLLTGTIASEIAGIERRHIKDGYIYIRQAISRSKLRLKVKTEYRTRKIRITRAIQTVLDQVLARSKGRFIFTRPSGKHFCSIQFNKKWTAAVKKAGISKRVPYATRHTFAAWCLAVDINLNRVVYLMGHGSKQMMYERYGRYVEGLEEDRAAIRDFFGEDFCGETQKPEQMLNKSNGGTSFYGSNNYRHGEHLQGEQPVM